MLPVFPSTALRTNLSQVKQAADQSKTIITDSGNTQYVFASEAVFAESQRREAEEAAYAERMARGIRQARAGIRQGTFVEGADAAIAEAERRMTTYG